MQIWTNVRDINLYILHKLLVADDQAIQDTMKTAASFTKEVNPWLAKRPLLFIERLANLGLNSLVKEATWVVLLTWINFNPSMDK